MVEVVEIVQTVTIAVLVLVVLFLISTVFYLGKRIDLLTKAVANVLAAIDERAD